MDVNAVVSSDLSDTEKTNLKEEATSNLKRIIFCKQEPAKTESPYPILATQEIKTTWHPIESSIAGGSAY